MIKEKNKNKSEIIKVDGKSTYVLIKIIRTNLFQEGVKIKGYMNSLQSNEDYINKIYYAIYNICNIIYAINTTLR